MVLYPPWDEEDTIQFNLNLLKFINEMNKKH